MNNLQAAIFLKHESHPRLVLFYMCAKSELRHPVSSCHANTEIPETDFQNLRREVPGNRTLPFKPAQPRSGNQCFTNLTSKFRRSHPDPGVEPNAGSMAFQGKSPPAKGVVFRPNPTTGTYQTGKKVQKKARPIPLDGLV
jgi:hypothetical protein